MRARRWEEKGQLEAESRSTPGAAGPEAAAQQARRGGQLGEKRKRGRAGGVEDRKDGTTEAIREQQALYTRAKRREGANPDRGGLNLKRQRTGSQTTYPSPRGTRRVSSGTVGKLVNCYH